MSEVLPTLVWTMLIAGFGFVFLMIRLVTILKSRHRTIYLSLGKPSYFIYAGLRKGWGAIRFIKKRDYNSLGDSELIRLCNFTRNSFYCYLVFFLTFMGMLFTNLGKF